jgi:hypothetical protein
MPFLGIDVVASAPSWVLLSAVMMVMAIRFSRDINLPHQHFSVFVDGP